MRKGGGFRRDAADLATGMLDEDGYPPFRMRLESFDHGAREPRVKPAEKSRLDSIAAKHGAAVERIGTVAITLLGHEIESPDAIFELRAEPANRLEDFFRHLR